jgi:hypothetical protein
MTCDLGASLDAFGRAFPRFLNQLSFIYNKTWETTGNSSSATEKSTVEELSEMGRTCGTYGERRGAYRSLVGKPEGRRPLGRPRRRWEDNIKLNLFERLDGGGGAWTGSMWLRIGTGGGLLCIRRWTYRFHKMRVISWVAQDVLDSQEGLCSME